MTTDQRTEHLKEARIYLHSAQRIRDADNWPDNRDAASSANALISCANSLAVIAAVLSESVVYVKDSNRA